MDPAIQNHCMLPLPARPQVMHASISLVPSPRLRICSKQRTCTVQAAPCMYPAANSKHGMNRLAQQCRSWMQDWEAEMHARACPHATNGC